MYRCYFVPKRGCALSAQLVNLISVYIFCFALLPFIVKFLLFLLCYRVFKFKSFLACFYIICFMCQADNKQYSKNLYLILIAVSDLRPYLPVARFLLGIRVRSLPNILVPAPGALVALTSWKFGIKVNY